jgi:hypothetical protein
MTPSGNQLYSPDVNCRYKATLRAAGRDVIPRSQRWPAGCGGAANAFLVLIGPSPGGARQGQLPPPVARTARS